MLETHRSIIIYCIRNHYPYNHICKYIVTEKNMEAIQTIDLTKKYKDVVAVDKMCLQIMQGELFSLLGVNGAGKTTAIKMLSCLTKPTSGDGYVGGKSILKDEVEIKSIIGVSPQETPYRHSSLCAPSAYQASLVRPANLLL